MYANIAVSTLQMAVQGTFLGVFTHSVFMSTITRKNSPLLHCFTESFDKCVLCICLFLIKANHPNIFPFSSLHSLSNALSLATHSKMCSDLSTLLLDLPLIYLSRKLSMYMLVLIPGFFL